MKLTYYDFIWIPLLFIFTPLIVIGYITSIWLAIRKCLRVRERRRARRTSKAVGLTKEEVNRPSEMINPKGLNESQVKSSHDLLVSQDTVEPTTSNKEMAMKSS
ncbi:hypothetical protein BgiMline_007755 [Biomphalaria glabrata]|uniref:Uncharacterized protein LOC106071214 n=1 Tax=Biomphalaria glabrata TaxID=6526 RepID=A0A9U8EH98_BIOGL|nr:uncharacterized protein LOC106071214 [Biomphalaria glabrata]KAI8746731.1 hypothetical protein BgiMline_018449 [Biomphalaria glabrata]KAI8788421.1 hypothetical protein BgiBS90_011089 [Biomphalaria glabrata]